MRCTWRVAEPDVCYCFTIGCFGDVPGTNLMGRWSLFLGHKAVNCLILPHCWVVGVAWWLWAV
jgi:hypothetical protein